MASVLHHHADRPFPAAVRLRRRADTMQSLAAPMIGGLPTSFVAELLLYPVLFYSAKRIARKRNVS